MFYQHTYTQPTHIRVPLETGYMRGPSPLMPAKAKDHTMIGDNVYGNVATSAALNDLSDTAVVQIEIEKRLDGIENQLIRIADALESIAAAQ